MAKRKSGGSWKKERASVSRSGKRPRSNKYRPNADSSKRPKPGTRQKYWRGGHTKKDGTHVRGHYVENPHYKGKQSSEHMCQKGA